MQVLAKNTLFNALSGVTVQALSIVSGVLIARVFGPGGYGDLSFANVIVGYLMMATDFGIISIAIKRVAQDKENYGKYLLTYLVCRTALSVLSFVILAGIIYFGNFGRNLNLLIIAYSLMIIINILSVVWVFAGHQRMEFQSLCEIFEKLMYIALLFSGYFFIKSLLIVPISMAVSSLAAVFLGWILFVKHYNKFELSLNMSFMKELIFYSWPVGMGMSASRVNSNIDTLFVRLYHGNVITGEYNSAYRLINLLIMAGGFFSTALYPLVCEKAVGEKRSLEKTLSVSTKIFIYSIIPVSFLFIVIGPKLLVLFFGDKFVNGGIAVQLLSFVPPMLLISRLYGNAMTALNKQNSFMKIMIGSALLNIGLNYLLIPRYAMKGASIATVLTELMILVLAYKTLSVNYKIVYMKPLFKTITASCLMAIVIIAVKEINLLILLPIATVVYIAALFVVGGIDKAEMVIVNNLLKNLKNRLLAIRNAAVQ